MPVIPLTLSISLCLVFTFVIFFLRERLHGRAGGGAEHDSLLPLADDAILARAPADSAVPMRAPRASGCCTHENSPCAGCSKHTARS